MFSGVTRAAVVADLSPARRWHIVLARDRRFDGAFVCAVRSTGISCRPSCPSRRPRRELVTFFPIPEAAEQAGFRPCRRCHPTSGNGAHPDVALVRETCRRLDSRPDEPASLAALSAHTGTSPRRLQRAFRAVLGVTPRQYRDARRLERGPLGRWVGAILRTLEGHAPHLGLPLDVRATAFQRVVWEALRKIPYGSTRSYAEIARAIGRPRATRAVARACATNPAAIVIPCHRVVRADGDLGGYRWGIRRKRALIEGERATKANR